MKAAALCAAAFTASQRQFLLLLVVFWVLLEFFCWELLVVFWVVSVFWLRAIQILLSRRDAGCTLILPARDGEYT